MNLVFFKLAALKEYLKVNMLYFANVALHLMLIVIIILTLHKKVICIY